MANADATTPDERPAVANRRRALATVLLVVFVDMLGFGIIVPILPFYVRSFGVSDVFIGLLAASYSLMQFGFAPLLGRLSDQRGRRPVLLLSIAGSALAWTVFGLAGSLGSVVVLFVSRMLAGAMGGNIAAAQAYVADVTPPERRAGALGLIGAAFGLGFVFGPALGAVFTLDGVLAATRAFLPDAIPVTRYSLPSFAAAGLSLANLAVAVAFLKEPRDRRTASGTRPRGAVDGSTGAENAEPPVPTATVSGSVRGLSIRRPAIVGQFATALRDANLRGLVIAFFLLSLAFSGVQVMFIPFAADVYGYGESETALLLTYVGVLGVLVQGGLVGRLSRRYESFPLALAGGALLTAALVSLPFAPDLGRALFPPAVAGLSDALLALLGTLALLSAGNGLLSVSVTTLVSENASDATQGNAFGVTQGAGSLGRTVGPPAMAALYVLDHRVPFVVGALLLLPVLAILLAGVRRGGRYRR